MWDLWGWLRPSTCHTSEESELEIKKGEMTMERIRLSENEYSIVSGIVRDKWEGGDGSFSDQEVSGEINNRHILTKHVKPSHIQYARHKMGLSFFKKKKTAKRTKRFKGEYNSPVNNQAKSDSWDAIVKDLKELTGRIGEKVKQQQKMLA